MKEKYLYIPISWNEWVIGIAVLVGLMVLMRIPVVKYFTAVALSLGYGYSGYLLFGIFADIFFNGSESIKWLGAILLFSIGGMVQSEGMRYGDHHFD